MQNDKDRLNHDFGFLDEAKPRDAETKAVSKYRVNWRNIIIIVAIIGGLYIWVSMSDNTPSSRPYQSDSTPPAAGTGDTVSNGQFRCSSYDSHQADVLSPTNEVAIQQETDDLKRRTQALDALSAKINTSAINQSSSQNLIDGYNGMVESYNAKLTAFKADGAAHHHKVETFNAQVEAHNNYLIAHCRRAY